MFAKDLTGCFSHCCVEGGDHKLKYLGSFITNEGSKPEILSRIAQTATTLKRFGMTGAFLSVPRYE